MKRFLSLACAGIFSLSVHAQKKKTPVHAPQSAVKAAFSEKAAALDAEVDFLFKQGNYPGVIEKAEEKLKMAPGDTIRLVLQTISYAMINKKEMAVQTARKLYPEPVSAAGFIATLPNHLSREVMLRDGAWYADAAIAISPNSVIPYMMKAAYLTDDSAYAAAGNAAAKAWSLASDQEKKDLGGSLAQIMQKAGDRERAFRMIDELVSKQPEQAELVKSHYSMLLLDKQWEAALRELNHLIRLTPADSLRLRKERVYLYHDMGREQDACDEATQLAALSETYEELLTQYACPAAFANLSPLTVRSYVYEVEQQGSNYDFVVQPRISLLNGGISFNWRMTDAENSKGKLTISQAALDTAHRTRNNFTSGDLLLNDRTTVWLSKAVYRELKEKKTTVIWVKESGPETFRLVTEPEDYETVGIGTEGKSKLLKTLHLRSLDGKDELWLLDDPANPILTRMEIGWKIRLRNIY